MTNFTASDVPARPIRSFVRRFGRMTQAQRSALDRHWTRYGIEATDIVDLDRIFGRRAPRYLEIGFGMGDMLIHMALAHAEWDYLGIEVHDPGIGRLFGQLANLDLHNVRAVRGDANDVLARLLPDESLEGIFMFFPDPWPKKRHHKRRLVQPQFVSSASAKLRTNGLCHIVTDVEDYAKHMLNILEQENMLQNLAPTGGFSRRPPGRPTTKFERRGLDRGHSVWDLMFVRRESHLIK
nr:tRNA (guanosine(46)-N7)-methyltransferase TrmB [Gammaproteobacteria bacterium]